MLEAIYELRALRLSDHAAALELDQRLAASAGSFDTEDYAGATAAELLIASFASY